MSLLNKIYFLCLFTVIFINNVSGQCYTNPLAPEDHDFPAPIYSNPQIFPESDLLNSNPTSDQLNPKLIHVIILGDGYKILNDSYSSSALYEVVNSDQLSSTLIGGANVEVFRLFDNVETNYGLFNLEGDPLIDFSGYGEANNLIDFMTGNSDRNLEGISPYKEYRDYFRFYKVLYNSEENGIGHPNSNGVMSSISCDNPGTSNAPLDKRTFWENEFDFCNTHRAIKANYNKIDCFINKYFSALAAQGRVFVVVLSNTSSFGAAANIPKQICSTVANYSTEFEENFVNCGTGDILYNDYDERIAIHEFSHIFAKLQDEYFFPFVSTNCIENLSQSQFYSAPNRFWFNNEQPTNAFPFTSTNAAVGGLPWNHWLTAPEQNLEIGNFRHGYLNQCTGIRELTYDETVRKPVIGYENVPCNQIPSNSCLMENVLGPFCAVCQEAIIERIHTLVNPINNAAVAPSLDEVHELTDNLKFSLGNHDGSGMTLPNPNTIRVTWELEDENDEVTTLERDFNGAPEANASTLGGNSGGTSWTTTDGEYSLITDCARLSNEAGLQTGNYILRARVYDMTVTNTNENDNSRLVRHPQHMISEATDTERHEWTVEWNVHYTAEPDLYISDRVSDFGSEPSFAGVNWESNSIWIRNQDDDIQIHQNPEYSVTEPVYVYVNIMNRSGCVSFDPEIHQGEITLNWTKATVDLTWPTDWDGSQDFNGGSNPIKGNNIGSIGIDQQILKKPNPSAPPNLPVSFHIEWLVPNPNDYEGITNVYVDHYCLLARINSVVDPMNNEQQDYPVYDNVRFNNNIAQKNVSVVDEQTTSQSHLDLGFDDVVPGTGLIVNNAAGEAKTVKIQFVVPGEETGKPITEEAQVRLTLDDSLWSKWQQGGQLGNGVSVYNASRKQLLLTSNNAHINNITLDSNSLCSVFLSVNYLTSERTSKENFMLRLIQSLDDSTETYMGGETYLFRPSTSRSLFSADAGNDKEIIVGDTGSVKAKTISETGIYNWYSNSGEKLHSGTSLSESSFSLGTATYILEFVALSDGYKDYDQVTVKHVLGKITSMVPNPVSSGTLAIGYKVSSSVTNPKIRLVNINTQAYTEHIISSGTGTLNVNIAGYVAGAYSVIILDGSNQSIDDELLVIQ